MISFKTYVNEWKLNDHTSSNVDNCKYNPKSFTDLCNIVEEKYNNMNDDGILDLQDINVSLIKSFYDKRIGHGCTDQKFGIFQGLNTCKIIDITGWNTSNATSFMNMFARCKKLKEIRGIQYIDISNAENTCAMFEWCESLKILDLSKWNPKNVLRANTMFKGCQYINIKGIDKWDMPNIKEMYEMFDWCPLNIIPDWFDKLRWG